MTKTSQCRVAILIVAIAGLVWLVPTARADAVLSVSTGFTMTDIGQEPGFGGDFDELSYSGSTNSITLAPNTPTVEQVNTYVYTVGTNSNTGGTYTGLPLDPWTISINGSSAQTVNQIYDTTISSSDSVTVYPGAQLKFDLGAEGTLYVTPLGYTAGPQGNGVSAQTSVDATLTLVPVPLPASAGIGFSMLAGVGILAVLRKRFSRRVRIA
jgi:hypothetical protein